MDKLGIIIAIVITIVGVAFALSAPLAVEDDGGIKQVSDEQEENDEPVSYRYVIVTRGEGEFSTWSNATSVSDCSRDVPPSVTVKIIGGGMGNKIEGNIYCQFPGAGAIGIIAEAVDPGFGGVGASDTKDLVSEITFGAAHCDYRYTDVVIENPSQWEVICRF